MNPNDDATIHARASKTNFVTIVSCVVAIFTVFAAPNAIADDTFTINCTGSCDTEDTAQAQAAATILGASTGDTIIYHNMATGQTTQWAVNSSGNVSKVATYTIDTGGQGIDYSGPANLITTWNFYPGLGLIPSVDSSSLEAVCLSAFPCAQSSSNVL